MTKEVASMKPVLILAFALWLADGFPTRAASGLAQGETWNWGELAYSRVYDTKLEIPSTCPCSVEVTIEKKFVDHPPLGPPQLPPITKYLSGSPYLTIAEKVIIPPGGGSVPAKIRTPPAPVIPRTVAGVALNDLTLVEGDLILTSRVLPDCCDPEGCDTKKTYTITGHIHLDPGSGGSGREPVDCDRYWEDERQPPDEVEETCVDRIRDLARLYLRDELAPDREDDPDAWSWLPGEEAIGGMSSGELLDMKARAESIRRPSTALVDPGAVPAAVR
jgi:hypothetical protein